MTLSRNLLDFTVLKLAVTVISFEGYEPTNKMKNIKIIALKKNY